jgi:hypothetical protein
MTGLLYAPAHVTAPRFLAGRLLRGCNVHHRSTVFVQRVDLGVLSGRSVADAGVDFTKRFVERFGSLTSLTGNGRLPQGDRGVPFASLLLEAILAVERFVAGAMHRLDEPGFATLVPGDGFVDLVWSAHKAWIARAAAKAALAGVIELLPNDLRDPDDHGTDFTAAITALRRIARRRQLSTTAAMLAADARRRGVAHELLAGNYLRVGEGAMQRVVSEAALRVAAGRPGTAQPPRLLHRVLPRGAATKIPIALIVGVRGARAVARRLDRVLRTTRDGVALAIPGRTTLQGESVDRTSLGRRTADFLLGDPRVRTAITTIGPRRFAARGLGLDRVSVTAVLDHVPGTDLELYRATVTRLLAATTGMVVIDADNPLAPLALSSLGPWRTLVVASDSSHELVRRQNAQAGFVAQPAPVGDDLAIVLRRGRRIVARLPVPPLDARAGGPRLRRALFTAGLLFGLETVKTGAER